MELLSFKRQLLLLEIYENRFIKFHNQKIYRNKRYFRETIEKFKRAGMITNKILDKNAYMTTQKGELFVAILKEFEKA